MASSLIQNCLWQFGKSWWQIEIITVRQWQQTKKISFSSQNAFLMDYFQGLQDSQKDGQQNPTHTHWHTHVCTHTLKYLYTHMFVHIHAQTYRCVPTDIYVHTHKYMYTNADTHTNTCMHARTYTHTQILTHVCTHLQTYMYAHKHTYNHTHTHSNLIMAAICLNRPFVKMPLILFQKTSFPKQDQQNWLFFLCSWFFSLKKDQILFTFSKNSSLICFFYHSRKLKGKCEPSWKNKETN